MNGVVYLLTNLVNGKYYIGQTQNISNRKWAHAKMKSKTPIAFAINKYGWDKFSFEILGEAEAGKALDDLERLWIITANATEKAAGYNIRWGGNSVQATEESRKRMSEAQKRNPVRYWLGKRRPDNAERNKAVFTGKKAWNSGTKKPKVLRGPAVGERNGFYGKTHSPEMRELISKRASEGLRGYYQTEAGKEHHRKALLARWAKWKSEGKKVEMPIEQRLRQSDRMREQYKSPELREKMRQAALTRWAKVRAVKEGV